ncbi:MAG: hypothetical protein ACYCSI_15610 [Solirubrobacteraceae bacterium]
MGLRAALAVALLLVVGALALDLSGSAPRLSGTNHVDPRDVVVRLASGRTLCQPGATLPPDTGAVKLLARAGGHPLPSISATLRSAGGATIAHGTLAAGARPGYVRVPLSPALKHGGAGTLCLAFGAGDRVAVFGTGEAQNASVATVGGHAEDGKIALFYLRPGSESWWQLLPTLARRFSYGKASFLGVWALPLLAFLLLLTWVGAIRLLAREAS